MSRARITQAGTTKPGTAQAHSPLARALKAFGALLLLTLVAWGAGILQPVLAQTKPTDLYRRASYYCATLGTPDEGCSKELALRTLSDWFDPETPKHT